MSESIASASPEETPAPASPAGAKLPAHLPAALTSRPPENAAASKKRRLEQISAAHSLARALCLDPVIEAFAEAGYGYVDVVNHVGNLITEAAETIVIRKVIECVYSVDPQSYFQVFTERGEHLHEPLRGYDTLAIVKHLRNCADAAVLSFESLTINKKGWIKFVWDNDPSEVISDYSRGKWLEETIKPAQEFATKLEGTDSARESASRAWREVALDPAGGARRYGVRF